MRKPRWECLGPRRHGWKISAQGAVGRLAAELVPTARGLGPRISASNSGVHKSVVILLIVLLLLFFSFFLLLCFLLFLRVCVCVCARLCPLVFVVLVFFGSVRFPSFVFGFVLFLLRRRSVGVMSRV